MAHFEKEASTPVGRPSLRGRFRRFQNAVVRSNPHIPAIPDRLIGGDLQQIINQFRWMTSSARETWGLHRDARSRTPDNAVRELAIGRHESRTDNSAWESIIRK